MRANEAFGKFCPDCRVPLKTRTALCTLNRKAALDFVPTTRITYTLTWETLRTIMNLFNRDDRRSPNPVPPVFQQLAAKLFSTTSDSTATRQIQAKEVQGQVSKTVRSSARQDHDLRPYPWGRSQPHAAMSVLFLLAYTALYTFAMLETQIKGTNILNPGTR